MGVLIDESGNEYGRALVLRRGPNASNGDAQWWCSCECGNEFLVRGHALRTGHTRSCGCLATDTKRTLMEEWREQNPDWVKENLQLARDARRLPEGEAAFNVLLGRYTYEANKRGIEFSLSRKEFRKVTQQTCHYCGVEPQQEIGESKRLNGVYVYNGIDRVDSNKGYISKNVVACCLVCNFAKRDMSYADFTQWLDRIVNFRGEDCD